MTRGRHPKERSDSHSFREKTLRELKKIKIAWPGLNYETGKGVLILYPSTSVIAPSDQRQLAS